MTDPGYRTKNNNYCMILEYKMQRRRRRQPFGFGRLFFFFPPPPIGNNNNNNKCGPTKQNFVCGAMMKIPLAGKQARRKNSLVVADTDDTPRRTVPQRAPVPSRSTRRPHQGQFGSTTVRILHAVDDKSVYSMVAITFSRRENRFPTQS
jgi:hypothetical protein